MLNDASFSASLVEIRRDVCMSSFMEFLLKILGNVLPWPWLPGWKYKGTWIVMIIISIILLIVVVSIILIW